MRLFREVLIESVEQAEKLPEGTLAYAGTGRSTLTAARLPLMGGRDYGWQDFAGPRFHAAMIGWTALVPVEAEEQWRASWPADDAHQPCRDEPTARLWAEKPGAVPMSRLVTPWTTRERNTP